MPPKQTTPKGLSPKIMRQKHVTRSNQRRENGHIFVPYTLPEYDSDTVSQRTKYRNHARRTLKALDDQAKMDERAAAHKLFAGAAGSSTQLASMVSPKKEEEEKKNPEPYGWSPDSELSPKNTKRDGSRPALRMHVGCTPPKAKQAMNFD
jgi:hypothetical protein